MEWLDFRFLALTHPIYRSLKLGHHQVLGSIHTYHRWNQVLDLAFAAARVVAIDIMTCHFELCRCFDVRTGVCIYIYIYIYTYTYIYIYI